MARIAGRPLHTGQQFDAVAVEYDFMAEIFHDPSFFLKHLPEHRTRALDLGCGSGVLVYDLADCFQEVVGVDLSIDLLAIARARRSRSHVLYCQMDIGRLGLRDGFDFIVSRSVFHHLVHIPGVIDEINSLLSPGGRLILTDVTSQRVTPPTIVYLVGAVLEYLPNVKRFGWKNANRVFRFRVSRHWLSHLSTDKYLSQTGFEQFYQELLPGCCFPFPGCLIWDKPTR